MPVVEELRRLGHDVVTLFERGKADQAVPDDEVLAFAKEEERILLTLNRKHFIRLHKQGADHSRIVVCTFDPDFVARGQRINLAVATQEAAAGKLIRVNRPG